MKKIISIFLIFCFINTVAFAVEFDSSIDASIRKDYHVEENDLPELPKALPTAGIQEVPPLPAVVQATGKNYTLKHGTKIELISRASISDGSRVGTYVSFSTSHNILTKEGYTIPAGTIFKGRITDSHKPQFTGNGGLIELCVDEIHLNGIMSKINTKISLANSKKVFNSDIKGQRKYWSNFAKVLTPGRKVFHGAQDVASAMYPIPGVNILSIIPLAGGAAVYTVNFIAAPIITIFTKGGTISLPAGTQFQIKITEDSIIKG